MNLSEIFCDLFMQGAKGEIKIVAKINYSFMFASHPESVWHVVQILFMESPCFASSNRNLTYSAGFCSRNYF